MKEFRTAAKQAVEAEDDEPILEFSLAGQEFKSKLPTTGQVALVAGSFYDGNAEMVGALFAFLRNILLDDGYRRLRKLVADGTIPFEVIFGGNDDNEQGIVEWITAETAARPTKQPSDFLPSQKSGGAKSTGRSRGEGSIHSVSASGSS